jgi:hypothetical protein
VPKSCVVSRLLLRAACFCAAALLNRPRSPLPLSYRLFHSPRNVPMEGFSAEGGNDGRGG